MDIAWADPETNRRHAAEVIARLPHDVELIVLPEMFSTGFATQPQGIAEPALSPTLLWMQAIANERQCAMAGSIAVQADEQTFVNRFYFVKPGGQASRSDAPASSITHYDKHHLFTYGGEDKQFTAGRERVVVEYRGVRIRLAVCYDLRFPAWCRNRDDYDLLLVVASWPTPRADAWSTLLKARSIENQCFVAGVNRVGDDPSCNYNGCSVIHDAYGRTLAACQTGQECAATAEIDMEKLKAFRAKFPVLRDADDFRIEL